MSWKVYNSNQICSFEVYPDELVMDIVYIKGYKAIQDTWYGHKMIYVDSCWAKAENVIKEAGRNRLKNLNVERIEEPNFVFDTLSREGLINTHDIKDDEIAIENSEFQKWFNELNTNSEGKRLNSLYYKVESDEHGICTGIKIYCKGYIKLNTVTEIRYIPLYVKDNREYEITRTIADCMQKYPFYYISMDGDLIFSDMVKDGEMKYIL